jgi:Uma2 family endonuclease
MADVVGDLGNVPLARIRATPAPGTATIEDAVRFADNAQVRCELVDGILVEKPMGAWESSIAAILIELLGGFVRRQRLGRVFTPNLMIQLLPEQMRLPDVSFISNHRLPGGKIPKQAVLQLVPELAIEVLSPSNTNEEMDRKRGEYFAGGVIQVWEVDPRARTVSVYTSPESPRVYRVHEALEGGELLPGFSFAVAELFADLEEA